MNEIKSPAKTRGCGDCARPTWWLGSLSYIFTFLVLTSCFPEDQAPLYRSNEDYYQDLSVIKDSRIMQVTELEGTVIITGNNTLYFASKEDLSLIASTDWHPTEAFMTYCHSRNGGQNCDNFIMSVVQNPDNRKIVVCGTNALLPTCRYYKDLATLMANASEFEQEYQISNYFCPFLPAFGSTLVYTDGDLYASTPTDSTGTKFAFSRGNVFESSQKPLLFTEISTPDSRTLSNPEFLTSYSVGDKLYYFFRENAQECSNCDKVVYSRVAKVCKSDEGGNTRILDQQWTTFQKARLGCSITGDMDFYFHELQDTFLLSDGDDQIVYGVFTTSENSIPGSAVCAFSLSEINNIFENGQFLEREDINSIWEPVPDSEVPEPRPAQCHEDTASLPDSVLEFAKDHPLMSDIVPARESDGNLFTVTRQDYQLTAIAVDEIQGKDGVKYRIIYMGTNTGLVLKAVEYELDGKKKSHLLEEINMVDSATSGSVRSLNLAEDAVLVNVVSGVQRLPFQRCAQLTQCACVQDPYCGWDSAAARCDTYQDGFEQNVENVQDCGVTSDGNDDGLGPATISGGGVPALGANSEEGCSKFETLAIAGWVVAILALVICGLVCVFKRRRRQPSSDDPEKGASPTAPVYLPNEKNEQIAKQNNIDINKKKLVTNQEGKSFVSVNQTPPNGTPDILNNRTKSTVSLDSSYEKTDYI